LRCQHPIPGGFRKSRARLLFPLADNVLDRVGTVSRGGIQACGSAAETNPATSLTDIGERVGQRAKPAVMTQL